MKLIFLDIDGVLNAHEKLPSGYCGIARQCVDQLNRILAAVPDAQLVISSAWRYLMLNDAMTHDGFEYLLMSHGVNCHKRIHGHTEPDPNCGENGEPAGRFDAAEWQRLGSKWRVSQIFNYVYHRPAEHFVVLDDLALIGAFDFIRTDGLVGLTAADADRAIAMLSSAPPAQSPGEERKP